LQWLQNWQNCTFWQLGHGDDSVERAQFEHVLDSVLVMS